MPRNWTELALIAGFGFAGTAAMIPPLRALARRLDAVDRPGGGKAHTSATPYLGGVAIAVAVAAAGLLLLDWGADRAAILGVALGVAALGLADDVWDLRPGLRVTLEVAAALAAFTAGVQTELLAGHVDVVLTVAWLVLVTNAFNLLDNMDGCAGLVATVTATALAAAAALQGQELVAGLAAAVAGSSAGFLLSNWFPARIFMGDTGSLFLGFLLATITLELRFPEPHTRSVPAVVLLAGPGLFDTTLVVVSRLLAGRPVTAGGTDHTSHRLRRLGLSVPAVATIIGAVTAACATLGVLVGRGLVDPVPAVAVPVAVAAAMMVGLLLVPVYDEEGAGRWCLPIGPDRAVERPRRAQRR